MSVQVRPARPEDFEFLPLMKQFAGVRDEGLLDRYQSVLKSPDFLVLVATLEKRLIDYAPAQSYTSIWACMVIHFRDPNIRFSRSDFLNKTKARESNLEPAKS
jgi:hypothetical protein